MTPLVRMVNEWVYCPRLAYLEWVEGEWADTARRNPATHVRWPEGPRAFTLMPKGVRAPSRPEALVALRDQRSIG